MSASSAPTEPTTAPELEVLADWDVPAAKELPLYLSVSLIVDRASPISALHIKARTPFDVLRIEGAGHTDLTLHLGQSDADHIATIDRLIGVLDGMRASARERLGDAGEASQS